MIEGTLVALALATGPLANHWSVRPELCTSVANSHSPSRDITGVPAAGGHDFGWTVAASRDCFSASSAVPGVAAAMPLRSNDLPAPNPAPAWAVRFKKRRLSTALSLFGMGVKELSPSRRVPTARPEWSEPAAVRV